MTKAPNKEKVKDCGAWSCCSEISRITGRYPFFEILAFSNIHGFHRMGGGAWLDNWVFEYPKPVIRRWWLALNRAFRLSDEILQMMA